MLRVTFEVAVCDRGEVIYSVVAEDLSAAWQHFRNSRFASTPIFSVIKADSEIYLLP